MNDFTLIIITHNRQRYLPRILHYYADSKFPVFVADSSDAPFPVTGNYPHLTYFHLPGLSLIEKLAIVLDKVTTKFVAINGEDDFITPPGIERSIAFLQENSDYSSAKGNCYYFRKEDTYRNITYFTIYSAWTEYKNDSNDIFKRLERYFEPYCTLYTACHYTENLLRPFSLSAGKVRNLFLNEYLTGIYPMAKGKHAELPFLYQLRESAEISDGNTTANLDQLILGTENGEFEEFLKIHAALIALLTGESETGCKNKLKAIMTDYAFHLQKQRNRKPGTLKQYAELFISKIPVAGKSILDFFFYKKMNRLMNERVVTEIDKLELKKIEKVLKDIPVPGY